MFYQIPRPVSLELLINNGINFEGAVSRVHFRANVTRDKLNVSFSFSFFFFLTQLQIGYRFFSGGYIKTSL